MGSRGPSAQYAYGITVELNKDYQKELKTLSDGLENLDKKLKQRKRVLTLVFRIKGIKDLSK